MPRLSNLFAYGPVTVVRHAQAERRDFGDVGGSVSQILFLRPGILYLTDKKSVYLKPDRFDQPSLHCDGALAYHRCVFQRSVKYVKFF